MIVLAVDCMGGDHGPGVTLPACRQFLDSHADAQLLLATLIASKRRPAALAEIVAAAEFMGCPVTASKAWASAFRSG